MSAHAGTSADGMTTGEVKNTFDFSASDFATLVRKTVYVDKSLMIRDVYNSPSRILITAPPRFGKSTNLNMVKRFFEIEVDALGNTMDVDTRNNYKLFKDYNLEICKDIDFVDEQFGKYPVVYIDFKPLGHVDDADKIIDAFKIIIQHSFNEHSYILQHSLRQQVFSGITGFDENYFRKCVSGTAGSEGNTCNPNTHYNAYGQRPATKINAVNEVDLANTFSNLSTILKRFFGKTVFVLIDSYDALLDSPIFSNNTARDKMTSFVQSSIGQLLNKRNCVGRVLITGVVPVIFEGFLSSKNNVEFYQFLDSHPFTKYYGLTSAEVDTVLSKVTKCDEERREVKNTINDYYNAYETRDRGIRVYNVWSVLQCVYKRAIKAYWCDRRYVKKFEKCLKIEPIRQKLQKLLVGNELELDPSQPLSITDVLKVNNMITSGETDHLSVAVDLVFVLFYHFGYFSVINEYRFRIVSLRIPSEEIQYQLVKVFNENNELYRSPHLNEILLALEAFHPDATDLNQTFNNIDNIIRSLKYYGKLQYTNTLEFLFLNLVARTRCSRVVGRRLLGPDGPISVLLKNRQQVAICVTSDDSNSAEIAHDKVTHYGGGERIFDVFNDVRGKVIIAMGSIDSQCGIAYSYYFKMGDNLQEIRTVPNIGTQ